MLKRIKTRVKTVWSRNADILRSQKRERPKSRENDSQNTTPSCAMHQGPHQNSLKKESLTFCNADEGASKNKRKRQSKQRSLVRDASRAASEQFEETTVKTTLLFRPSCWNASKHASKQFEVEMLTKRCAREDLVFWRRFLLFLVAPSAAAHQSNLT